MAQLRSLFTPTSHRREAQELYIALVEQSRKPFFYETCAVPDTLDGRFDVIVMHIFLALRSISHARAVDVSQTIRGSTLATNTLQRLLLEALFDDMDRSLREMGVGDMGVGKRVKIMSKAVFGRLEAYTASHAKATRLQECLVRNVYRGVPPKAESIATLQQYMLTYAL